MSAKLPGLQPVRTGDPAQDRFLEAVRERLEVREGARGDPLEAVVLQRDLIELGIKRQGRVPLPDGKPGFVTQLADGSFVSISADELVSRLESTDWYRSLSSGAGGVTDDARAYILSAITEEISKRGAEDRRLDAIIDGVRDELLRKIGDLSSRINGASAAPPIPNNYDTFSVTLLSDNTRVFTFAYTTTPIPIDLAGAVIRFTKGATGTETWSTMSPLHEGVLTNSPTETRAGDPDNYRFALKARSRSGLESSDATVRYVNITLPALSDPAGVSVASDSIIFLQDATGTAVNPTITLTASLAGSLTGTVTWSHSSGYSGSTPSGTNTWVVNAADQTADQVTYTATKVVGASTYTDSVVLYRIRQGAEQIVVALTNPVISVPATSAGVVTTFTAQTTELLVYYGGDLASDSLLTYTVASDPSGTGLTVASTGVYTLSFPGSPSGWWTSSATSASVVLRAALVSDPTAYREITLVITKNLAGAPGTVPDSINLESDSIIFLEDATGTLTNPTITLTAALAGTLAGGTVTWSHSTGYGGSTPTGTNTWAVSGASQTADQVTYTATITAGSSTYTDSVVLYKVRQGAEQIVVVLTNPVISVPATSAGVVTTFTAQTTELQVYYGGSLASDSLLTYTVASDPSGTGLTVASTGIYTLAFPGSPSGWWTSSAPSANVVLRAALVSDPTAYRDITLVITKNLAGAAGAPGTVPDSIRLDASVLAFSFDTAGTAYPAAQSSVITLTREPGTIAGTATWSATAFDSSGGQVGTTGTVGLTGSGDSRTLTTGNFIAPGGSFSNNVYYVNVTATLGALSKTVRVIRITDGVEPILSFLTVPSVTLPASSAGVVSSWAGATGDFQVWQGASEVTSGVTYAIQSNPSSLTASINSSTGIYSVTGAGSWANGSNTTSITFRATHTATGATRDAVLTLAKALAGGTGSAGAPGADAVVYEIEPSPSSVSRNNIGVATPSSVTFAAYSKTGSAARVAFSGRFTIETFIDPTWTGQYTSTFNESSKTYTVPASVTAIRVKLYANGYLSPLLQQVTVPVVPDGIRSPMTLNSNSSATAVYGTVTSGAVNWTDAKGNEVVWRKLGYTSAPSATPADYLVRTDLVTLFDANPPTAGVKPATRYWTGSAWVDPGTVIDGNLLVKGTVTLDAIKSGSTIGTSNVSFGLGVSWGPGTAVSGGYFHSTSSAQFALVCDNIGGGYSIASATTATNDSGAAFAGGGGWTGHTTTGGVTSGGTYTTYGFIATGTAGGIFRYGSTTEALLGKSTAAGVFTQGSYVGTLAASSYAAEFKYGTTTNAKFGNTTTAGTFVYGSNAQVATLGTATYAGKFAYGTDYDAVLGDSANSIAVRARAGGSGAYSRSVSLCDGNYAVNIDNGLLRYGAVTIAVPPNNTDYLNGDGTWKHMYLDGSSGVPSNYTGSRPSGTTVNNIWISFYVGSTRLWIPAWYADS